MTDYRLRNHNLLYAESGHPPLGWRNLAIFGSIVLTVTIGVVGYLADRFNAAGFAAPAFAAQQVAPSPAAQLATPKTTGS